MGVAGLWIKGMSGRGYYLVSLTLGLTKGRGVKILREWAEGWLGLGLGWAGVCFCWTRL